MDYSYIIDFLNENSSEDLVEFNGKLTPNSNKFLGVKIPLLRQIAKTIDLDKRIDFILNFREEYEEDLLLKAIVIGSLNCDIKTILSIFDDFKFKVRDWMVCDILCNSFKIAKKQDEIVFDYLKSLSSYDDEFIQRIVAVMMLSHFITDKYIDECFKVLIKLNSNKYYTDMAVGWFIATAYSKFSDKTYEFLTTKPVSKNQFRLALKKINESYRVDKINKEKVASLYKNLYE